MRERSRLLDIALHLGITLAIAVIIALIGPFGTFSDLGLGERLLYWLTIIPLNYVQIMAVAVGLTALPVTAGWPILARAAGATLLASVPAAFEVHWLEQVFRPEGVKVSLWGIYGYVAVLSLAIVLPLTPFMFRSPAGAALPPDDAPQSVPAPVAAAAAPETAPFLKRIPDRLGGTLLCVGAEDHYLRVYTDKGDDLILFRLGDAEAELATLDGLRVHRSWWVARQAVADIRRSGRKLDLVLVNGLTVPVSRNQAAVLRRAGWLTPHAGKD